MKTGKEKGRSWGRCTLKRVNTWDKKPFIFTFHGKPRNILLEKMSTANTQLDSCNCKRSPNIGSCLGCL